MVSDISASAPTIFKCATNLDADVKVTILFLETSVGSRKRELASIGGIRIIDSGSAPDFVRAT